MDQADSLPTPRGDAPVRCPSSHQAPNHNAVGAEGAGRTPQDHVVCILSLRRRISGARGRSISVVKMIPATEMLATNCMLDASATISAASGPKMPRTPQRKVWTLM